MRSCRFQGIFVSVFLLSSACAIGPGEDNGSEQSDDRPDWGILERSIDEGGFADALDEASEAEAPDDEAPEAEAPEDQTPDDEATDDEAPDDPTSFLTMASASGRLHTPPRIQVAFAFYGNLKKNWKRHYSYRYIGLPGRLPNGPRSHPNHRWFAINTLDKGYFAVWKYNEHGNPGWWNNPKGRFWLYDDTNRTHFPTPDSAQGENEQMRLAAGGHTDLGFVYMGYGGHFREVRSLPTQRNASYFYEVYGDEAFDEWHREFGTALNRIPMFDVSRVANFAGRKRCDVSKHPKGWNWTKSKMCEAIIERYRTHRNEPVGIGLYSGCFIESSDSPFLKGFLDRMQGRLEISRFDCKGL